MAQYREARVGGCTQASVAQQADGSLVLRSVEPLAGFPPRLTDALAHWAAAAPERVFAAIDAPKRETAPGLLARIAARLHLSQGQFGFVAAAAAVALVLVPFARSGPGSIAPSPSPSPAAAAENSGGEFQVHELAFDGAEGTVYTAGDDMPVIWVSESDDA